jgi:hypothetical protein
MRTERTTVEPITVDGWYKHTDGTWGEYAWNNGVVRCLRVADRPETPEDRSTRYAREHEEYCKR